MTSARSTVMSDLLQNPDQKQDQHDEEDCPDGDVHSASLREPQVINDNQQSDEQRGEPERAHGYRFRIEMAGVKCAARTRE